MLGEGIAGTLRGDGIEPAELVLQRYIAGADVADCVKNALGQDRPAVSGGGGLLRRAPGTALMASIVATTTERSTRSLLTS